MLYGLEPSCLLKFTAMSVAWCVQHAFYQALNEPDHTDDLQVKVIDTDPQLYK